MMKNLNHTGTLKEGINQIESQSLPNLYKPATWSRKKQERLIVPFVMNVLVGRNELVWRKKIPPSYLSRSRWFQRVGKKNLKWWRLVPSPTRHNEYFMLELSGAWEPTDNSRAQ